jgi:hypothetical protein
MAINVAILVGLILAVVIFLTIDVVSLSDVRRTQQSGGFTTHTSTKKPGNGAALFRQQVAGRMRKVQRPGVARSTGVRGRSRHCAGASCRASPASSWVSRRLTTKLESRRRPVNKGTTRQVQYRVDASPEVVYDLVTDVTRMGEWSPECVGCEWIDGADGPVPGARFRGRNPHRRARWSTKPRVVTANRPQEFTFDAGDASGRDLTVWTYRIAAAESGTEVTESFALLRDIPWYVQFRRRSFMGVTDRKADLEANMRRTLLQLKVVAEYR